MTVDEILAELPGLNLRLRNLFNLGDGWQANVCEASDDVGFQFGRGPTAVDALLGALKAAGVRFEEG